MFDSIKPFLTRPLVNAPLSTFSALIFPAAKTNENFSLMSIGQSHLALQLWSIDMDSEIRCNYLPDVDVCKGFRSTCLCCL